MIPGGVNPMLLSGGASGYQISRSLRFRAAASSSLSKTPPTAGNRKTWTWSAWVKRTTLGSDQKLFSAVTNISSDSDHTDFRFNSSDKFMFFTDAGGAPYSNTTSSSVYRDVSSHYHVQVALDTTQAVAANRVRIYINGLQLSAFDTNALPALNADLFISAATPHRMMAYDVNFQNTDGYLSEVYFVDGKALPPSVFGEFDADFPSYWKPLSPVFVRAYVAAGGGTRNGFGTNGFYLPFSDATSLTTLMYDRSQGNTDTSGNNWTANNISVTSGATYDSMLDVPLGGGGNERGNYATLNPLANNYGIGAGPTDGNLSVSHGGETSGSIAMALPTFGKWYWEVIIVQGGDSCGVGVLRNSETGSLASGAGYGQTGGSYVYRESGQKRNAAAGVAYGAAYGTGDVIGHLYDADLQQITFFKNGVSQGVAYSGLTEVPYFPVAGASIASTNNILAFNFGQRPFAATVPAGAKALHTGNLFNPPVEKSTNGFVNVVDTKANILTTLAAARNGWSTYVDIIKNRAAGESWGYRFSHLAGNEYSVISGAVTYQVNRSMTGTDAHVGRSIRIGAAYGTAAGSVNHTSGATTTVTHNVGASSRQAIYLFPRAGGSVIKLYHADLTPGKMLDLCSTAAETTDSSISGVTSSAFTIGAAMATGTYDYLLLSEVSGFLSLFKFNANGSANGPFANLGMSPKAVYMKAASNASNHFDWDTVRSPGNPLGANGAVLFQGNSGAEGAPGYFVDATANGVKVRSPAGYGFNETGQVTVGIAFAAAPFKNALAR